MDNDFIKRWKQNSTEKKQSEEKNESLAWDNSSLMGEFFKNYNNALKKRGEVPMDYQDFTLSLSDKIGRMGVMDGKWTEDEYKSGDFRKKDNYQEYANNALNSIVGGINPWRGNTATEMENAPQEVKEAYERLQKYGDAQWGTDALADRFNERTADDKNVFDVIGSGIGTAFDALGSGIATVWNAPYNASQKNADNRVVNEWRKSLGENAIDFFDNFDSYLEEYKNSPKEEEKKDAESSDDSKASEDNQKAATKASANDDDTVTFSLSRINDPNYKGFGQKIVDLGLATDKGLWGSGGDVEFYTQQLYDQGALDSRGNLKVGVPITLRRRK